MPFLFTVSTRDLTYVTCRPVWTTSVLIFFLLLIRLYYVNSDGGGRAFLLSVSVKSSVFFFFLLTSLLGGFSLMLKSRYFGLLGFRPRLLRSRVPYQIALSASPSKVGLVAIQISLIHLFDMGGGLQACLSLGIDRFLYNLVPTV